MHTADAISTTKFNSYFQSWHSHSIFKATENLKNPLNFN